MRCCYSFTANRLSGSSRRPVDAARCGGESWMFVALLILKEIFINVQINALMHNLPLIKV